MKPKRSSKRSRIDPMESRLSRLRDRLRRTDKSVVWLRAIPGAGKSRLLMGLKKGTAASHFADWLVLDDPDADIVRAGIEASGIPAGRPLRRLMIASAMNEDIARQLLTASVYGLVELIEDAEFFLTPHDCRLEPGLFTDTGGWPVLVDAWRSGRGAEIIATLPAFLEQEVLPRLPQPLTTALFAALAAPLPIAALDHLFGAEAPLHPLLSAAETGALVAGDWVREALIKLRGTPDSMPRAVHDQLIHVMTAFADPVRSIISLIEMGQPEQAVRVFERAGGMFFGYVQGFQALEEVLRRFGPEWERRVESLLFAHLFLLIKTGQARQALLRLESKYPELPVDLRRQRLTAPPFAFLMRIDISLDIDDTPSVAAITSWGRLETLLAADDDLARGVIHNTMVIAYLQAGALVEARQLAGEAIADYERARSPYLVHFMLLHLCDLALRQGRPRDAADHLRRAEESLRASHLEFNSELAILDCFRARIAYEEGRFADCPTDVEPILQALLRGDSWSDLISTTAGHFVFTAFFLQGLRKALDRFDHCVLTLNRRHGASQARALPLIRIRLFQIARRYAESGMHLEEYDIHPTARRSPHNEIEESLIRLRQQIIQQRTVDCLQPLNALAKVPGLETRQRISVAILQSELRYRAGEHGLARRHLSFALRHAEGENLLGVLVEDGQFLERLLPIFITDPGPGNARLAAFAQRIVRLLHTLPAAPMHAKSLAGISRQEHRVLSYLADGSTNKEIARALHLSEGAVKFHLRNLFRKLKVTSRADLLEAARRRGIVT
jgi:ATP/maltotriose-dependent transcriptional regulator MalT